MSDDEQDMTPEEWALAIVQSEPFFWLMVGSDHIEANLDRLRQGWEGYKNAGGSTWARDASRP